MIYGLGPTELAIGALVALVSALPWILLVVLMTPSAWPCAARSARCCAPIASAAR